MRLRLSAVSLAAIAGFVAIAGIATAQQNTTTPAAALQAGDPAMTALTSAGEATTARRLLMNSIGGNNDSLHDMLDGVLPWDDYVFQSRLLSMYAMFKAFPNLYRVEPNPWSEESEAADAGRVSLALPSVWEDWQGFVDLNDATAKNVLQAAFLTRASAKPIVDEIEQQCEACHELYRRSFADFHDFDMLPPAEQPVATTTN